MLQNVETANVTQDDGTEIGAVAKRQSIGFMQGRLSPIIDGKIQSFPWGHWQQEFASAQQHGFARMEWTIDQERLTENPLMTPAGRDEIRRLSDRHQITIHSLTADCTMQAPFWKAVGTDRDRLLTQLKALLTAAVDVGIRLVVVPLVDNGSVENPEQMVSLLAGLDEVYALLQQHDLKIVFESDYLATDLKSFIDLLDPNCFGINYDSGNSAALGYDPEVEIATYGDRIYNVHIKDRLLGGTTVPLGTGNANLPKVLQLLRQIPYSGQYILQTARAQDNDHAGVLCRYRNQVREWLNN